MSLLWLLDSAICFAILWSIGLVGTVTPPDAGWLLAGNDQAVWLVVLMSVAALLIGLYRSEALVNTWRMLAMLLIVAVFVMPAVAFGLRGARSFGHLYPRGVTLLEVTGIWVCCVGVTHGMIGAALRSRRWSRGIGIVQVPGAPAAAEPLLDERQAQTYRVGVQPLEIGALCVDTLRRERVWGLVLDGEAAAPDHVAKLVQAHAAGIRIYRRGDFLETHLRCLDIDTLPAGWFAFAGTGTGRLDAAVRWSASMAVTALLLLFTAPLMLAVAVLICLESPGGAFYRQERIGLHGKPYMLLKFRSMYRDAEAAGPVWAQQSDPRVTAIGRFIRRVRIDELPQLLNVLRGDMCLIGPRPERPTFVQSLSQSIAGYADRARVKPGITGWAQVNLPYGASVEDARRKLAYDLYYIKHRSWKLDLEIIVATVRVVLFQEGSR